MKVGILAGGLGSRLAEETEVKPKPMVEIGGIPIICHIMKNFAHFGFSDFVIAVGYKGDYIKRYMVDYCSLSGDLRIDFARRTVLQDGPSEETAAWRVDVVETGQSTNTGGRIKRLAPYLSDETFMLAWGDGVSDIDLKDLLAFHRSHGRLATVAAVRPPARFGKLDIVGEQVVCFSEKPQLEEGWINGGFFVLEPAIFRYIEGDETQWEREPLESLAREGELMAYRHDSFWQCMDTLRDKKLLQSLWDSGRAPWMTWVRS